PPPLPDFHSRVPTGWTANPGLVTAGGRVYGVLAGPRGLSVTALDEASGLPAWQQALPRGVAPRSLVASKDHLFVSMEDRLLALKLEDGKPEWERPTPAGGVVELSQGIVYLSTPDMLQAFAPAERTYAMAIDSSHGTDYPPDAQPSTPGPPASDRRHPLTRDPASVGAPPE